MVEFLFLMAFAFVLVITGVSAVGMILAMVVGFIVMAVAGMIGVVFDLLPWIILIAVAVWVYRRYQGPRNLSGTTERFGTYYRHSHRQYRRGDYRRFDRDDRR